MVIQHKSYPICPPWLKPLISAKFFEPCSNHSNPASPEASSGARIECNLYCLNCMLEPLCFSCTSSHKHHNIVQIRRSSYHDVIRVSEIQKVLDLSGVQSYIINSARVVFLNGRPQSKLAKGVTKTCEICERSLNDNFRYCSLGCKLQGISRHNDLTFMLQPKNQQQQASNSHQRMQHSPEEQDHGSQSQQQVSHRKSRSRKGSIAAKIAATSAAAAAATDEEENSAAAATKIPEDDPQEPAKNPAPAPAPEFSSSRSPECPRLDSSEEASGIEDGLTSRAAENFQENLVEISPSTPPQVAITVLHHQQRAGKRRKGTPHRSHLGGFLTLDGRDQS